jgi:hypothetical protein
VGMSNSHEDDQVMDEEEREALDMSLEDLLSLGTGEDARLARTERGRNDAFQWSAGVDVTVRGSKFQEEGAVEIRPGGVTVR